MGTPRIVIVGGGSYHWAPRLLCDFANTRSLENASVVLHDLDPGRLGLMQALGGEIARRRGIAMETIAEPDRARAIDGADVVITCLSVGGFDSMQHDIEIPRRYGIRTVGLCHSVQGTSRTLARILGIEDRHWTFRCAGINHQAWFTHFACDGVDATAELLDPLTAAVLPLERIHAMVEELLAAEAAWLPQL